MAEDKKVFLRIAAAVCAFEGKLASGTVLRKAWMLPILSSKKEQDFSIASSLTSRAILIDLQKSVDQHIAPRPDEEPIGWDEIEIEGVGVRSDGSRIEPSDGKPLRLNTFGTSWPSGANIGILSLEETFFKTHRSKIEHDNSWPYDGLQPYQCLSVLYKKGTGDRRSGKRYVGFEAELLDWSKEKDLMKVRIRKTKPQGVQGEVWLELDNVDECDVDIDLPKFLGDQVSMLRRGTGPGTIGGIFLEARHAAKLALIVDPKTPYTLGV